MILISIFFFILLCESKQLNLGDTEISIKKGSTSTFEIQVPDLYYMDWIPLSNINNDALLFCKLQLPVLTLNEYFRITYNLNDNINNQYFLLAENYLLLLLPNNSLISFKLGFNEKKEPESLTFSQIVHIDDNCLNNSNVFEKIIYDSQRDYLIINSCNRILFYYFQLSENNIFPNIRFYRSLDFNTTIISSEINDNFLYILLNETWIEIWNLDNLSKFNYLNFSDFVKIDDIKIIDIAINQNYIIILENITNSCYFIDKNYFILRNTLSFQGFVKTIKVTKDTLFIQYQTLNKTFILKEYIRIGVSSDYFYENNEFEMNSLVKKFTFLGDQFLISQHENLLTFISHSIINPKNITFALKNSLAWEGLEHLSSQQEKKKNGIKLEKNKVKNLMVLTTKKEIVILKPDQKKASLICSPNDSLDNKQYSLNIFVYSHNCTLDNCTLYSYNKEKINLLINVYQELFESSNIALAIGLGIGFSIAFIVTIIFCVYFYKIKNRYNTLVKETAPKDSEHESSDNNENNEVQDIERSKNSNENLNKP